MQRQNEAQATIFTESRLQTSSSIPSLPPPPPPPPYSETAVLQCHVSNSRPEVEAQIAGPHSPSIDQAQAYIERQVYRPAEVQTPPFRPDSGMEAPPLPPRSLNGPYQTPLVGLSDGLHNNVPFPPPPKRHMAPSGLYPPPLPQRPASSSGPSKFFGSSSAKRWLDRTNQALEDTLDAVLQGPAAYASRPTYVTHPQYPPRQGPQPPQAHSQRPGQANRRDEHYMR